MHAYILLIYVLNNTKRNRNRNKVHGQKLQITKSKSINHVKFYHQKIYIRGHR